MESRAYSESKNRKSVTSKKQEETVGNRNNPPCKTNKNRNILQLKSICESPSPSKYSCKTQSQKRQNSARGKRSWSESSLMLPIEEKQANLTSYSNSSFNKRKEETFYKQGKRANGDEDNAKDIYRRILGPTPDESVLAALQVLVDACSRSDMLREIVISVEKQAARYGCCGT